MKNNKLIFMGVFLIVLAIGIFLVINLDSKKESNKNNNNDNKTDLKDTNKDTNNNDNNTNDNNNTNNDNNNVANLNEVELGQEYQLICTYDADAGEYATNTYQTVNTFYSNGTCRYEFSHEEVYNNINDYNELKNSIKNKIETDEFYNEFADDFIFDDSTMTIKKIGGMGHIYQDMGESFCTDVKLNSTDELKEKIKPILEQNQTRNDVTCILYKK